MNTWTVHVHDEVDIDVNGDVGVDGLHGGAQIL